tara:strand:- start:61771 stop:62181 length:411 start_codon:yes stop_codon:yes gene_type:complete
MNKYSIEITYDTGDSFHQENGLTETISKVSWDDMDKAKKALKDIEDHYHQYMIINREWNAGKKEKDEAREIAMKAPWCYKPCEEDTSESDYWTYGIMLEDDDGERKHVHCFWTGYFEHLVGADILENRDKEMSFRT